jgi:hypothetical protein
MHGRIKGLFGRAHRLKVSGVTIKIITGKSERVSLGRIQSTWPPEMFLNRFGLMH